mmetsp:Transcript_9720/g.17701  ORF Transcript_9720/g.17701 Transcript_9720/m.17701 type:complete len:105 (-) Transcript_9720:64-378(-)
MDPSDLSNYASQNSAIESSKVVHCFIGFQRFNFAKQSFWKSEDDIVMHQMKTVIPIKRSTVECIVSCKYVCPANNFLDSREYDESKAYQVSPKRVKSDLVEWVD